VVLIRILGIDEAGRGSVIGPLVICGLVIDQKDEKKLKKIRVKDSKQLTPKKREELAPKIEKIATHIVVLRVPACKIDANRRRGINLNQIEAIKMAEIINLLEADKAIIDSPGYNTNKFRDYLWSKLNNKNIELVCENYADINYPVVSAASIIAKVDRDANIEELKNKVGHDFGVGYSHDIRTIEFLNKLAERDGGRLPIFVRHTWDTAERIITEHKQLRILNFLKKLVKKESDSQIIVKK
jgi:ribonuclease HII